VDADYAVIAGVNKAGTTSLFVSLSTHPGVAPSAVKETRYFLPARYGQPLAPPAEWEQNFAAAQPGQLRLEGTPSYFYGGAALAEALAARLGNVKVILLFREPVRRAESFFTYQKVRLRIPPETTLAEYLAVADRLTPDDFQDPANERYMAFRGGCYADFLPAWLDTFGRDHVAVLSFEEMIADPPATLRSVALWLGLDPDAFPDDALSSENRTTGYKNAALQRLALVGNDSLERMFRRHPAVKRRLRAAYYRVNGRAMKDDVPDALRDELSARYEEPNARLAGILEAAGYPLPQWLPRQEREPATA
jgi:hypothetical protein